MLRGRLYGTDEPVGIYEAKKVKRYRSAFTTGQINYLEKQFEKCSYIGSATRKEVSNLLNIPERAIKIWFQNRRMKEKKEVNTKEYNIDSHNSFTNNMECAKDSLNNVHSSQSTNDSRCSLPSTIAKHINTANCTNYYTNATFRNQSINDNLKKEIIENRIPNKFKDGGVSNITKEDIESHFLSQSANLMKYNPHKDYNNKNFVKYLEINKTRVTKSKLAPKTTLKSGTYSDSMLNAPSTSPQYQDLPEDLSARNLSNVMIPQNHQGNLHFSPAYFPFCNTQDVCLPAANVIWKPVNVMPTISPSTLPIPERQLTINPNNIQQCKCNCNCQANSRLNYDHGNTESQPQYIIAIPYNNNINILR